MSRAQVAHHDLTETGRQKHIEEHSSSRSLVDQLRATLHELVEVVSDVRALQFRELDVHEVGRRST